jgi:hypothetical protein
MSKGAKIVAVRFPPEEYESMLKQLADSEVFRRGEPMTTSMWVRQAVREKLAKMARSRASRRSRSVFHGDPTVKQWNEEAS